jgi:hypothetical protein
MSNDLQLYDASSILGMANLLNNSEINNSIKPKHVEKELIQQSLDFDNLNNDALLTYNPINEYNNIIGNIIDHNTDSNNYNTDNIHDNSDNNIYSDNHDNSDRHSDRHSDKASDQMSEIDELINSTKKTYFNNSNNYYDNNFSNNNSNRSNNSNNGYNNNDNNSYNNYSNYNNYNNNNNNNRNNNDDYNQDYTSKLTQEQYNQNIVDGILDSSNNTELSTYNMDNENNEDLKLTLLEKIDNLMEELEDDGISLDKIPKVDYNSDLDRIEYVTKLLMLKSNRNRYATLGEEFILAMANGLELLCNGDREFMGIRPDLQGYSDVVKVKLRRLRNETSQIVSNVVDKYEISPITTLLIELIPSLFLHSKRRKSQSYDNLYNDLSDDINEIRKFN